MSAVDTGFAAKSNAAAPAGGPKNFAPPGHTHTAAADFDSLMQARLEPPPDAAAGKLLPPIHKQFVPSKGATATPKFDASRQHDAQISAKPDGDQKISTPNSETKPVTETNPSVLAPEATQSALAGFSLPLFSSLEDAGFPADGSETSTNAGTSDNPGQVVASPIISQPADGASILAARGAIMIEKGQDSGTPTAGQHFSNEKSSSATGLNIAGMIPAAQNESLTSKREDKAEPSVSITQPGESANGKETPPGPLAANAGPAPALSTASDENNQVEIPATADVPHARQLSTEPPMDNGTGVAINAVPMKNPPKAIKVAESNTKVLPVTDNNGALEKNLPTPRLVPATPSADNRGADSGFSMLAGGQQQSVDDHLTVSNVSDLSPAADARMRALERTHDMISLHSMRLVESQSDTLAVIIKPSVGTELSLELRQRNGGIEAQATLTRGDHQFLSEHWPDLQQRLEQRGIRLSALGAEAGTFGQDSGQPQREPAQWEDPAQQASAFAEFASIPLFGATARLAPMHEGWESWA